MYGTSPLLTVPPNHHSSPNSLFSTISFLSWLPVYVILHIQYLLVVAPCYTMLVISPPPPHRSFCIPPLCISTHLFLSVVPFTLPNCPSLPSLSNSYLTLLIHNSGNIRVQLSSWDATLVHAVRGYTCWMAFNRFVLYLCFSLTIAPTLWITKFM
jgi:hypothetical protein